MSDYEAFVFHTNREDLLLKAVASIHNLRGNITVVDNSEDGITRDFGDSAVVFRPCVPLSASQSFNFAMKRVRANSGRFMIMMHEDAEAGPGAALKMVELARQAIADGRKWGMIFSNYDCFAALNIDTLDDPEVGLWDTNLPQYFTDNTQYRKMRLAGYEMIESGLPVVHVGSQTINSDPEKKFLNSITFPLYAYYYQQCWGGPPGQETFTKPFNRG